MAFMHQVVRCLVCLPKAMVKRNIGKERNIPTCITNKVINLPGDFLTFSKGVYNNQIIPLNTKLLRPKAKDALRPSRIPQFSAIKIEELAA